MKYIALSLFLWIFSIGFTSAQSAPEIHIEAMQISGLPGIQSYAFGQYDGKWIIIGGRLDGLHTRQPNVTFDVAGNNNMIWVVDPSSSQVWSAPLTSLPVALQEQMSSTNMNFDQTGDYLYLTGGYAYSTAAQDHVTFPYLTAVDLAGLTDAIMHSSSITPYFRQLQDTLFQITGGRLRKMDNTYYLLGGHKFMGRYNPMNNPTFTQSYSNSIRRFTIQDDGTNLNFTSLSSWADPSHLHRRDYNAEPQIGLNGEEEIMMYSGVFQQTQDLPFLYPVLVNSNGFTPNQNFSQYYNHYHCAALPLYSAFSNEMHHIFFGGIAQYFDSAGTLVQDNNVPFVNTIARVSRDNMGVLSEHKLPIEMPSLLGAGSEFIAIDSISHYPNHVFKMDEILGDSVLLGYIFGGIASPKANIFNGNNSTLSSAAPNIFKVYLLGNTTSLDHFNENSQSQLKLMVYPNPNDGDFSVSFYLDRADEVGLKLMDINGKVILQKNYPTLAQGQNELFLGIPEASKMGTYMLEFWNSEEHLSRKIILKR